VLANASQADKSLGHGGYDGCVVGGATILGSPL
jgi:hypothetical protein